MQTSVLNLLKSTRIHRTLTGLSAVMVPVAFANLINKGILLFCFASILLYASAGIQNAKKDNDYPLPDYTNIVVLVILLLSFIVAAFDKFALIGVIGEFMLGIFYNFFSRYIFLADVTTLTISHHVWPTFISSNIVGLDPGLTLKLCCFMFLVFWFIIHLKNLKDSIDDKSRGYKTLTTCLKNGKLITFIFFEISLLIIIFGYFLFEFRGYYLLMCAMIAYLNLEIISLILQEKNETALNFMRLVVIFFLFGFVIENVKDILIFFLSAIPFIFYCIFLYIDMKKAQYVL